MAILTPQQKKLRIFAFVFFAILIITGLVLYFGFLRQPTFNSGVLTNVSPLNDVYTRVQGLEIDWDFLESESVRRLEFFGEHPVQPGDKGRNNPFLPI